MTTEDEYAEAVRQRAERMKRARQRPAASWRSLAQVGVLGFVFILPLLLTTAAGRWLERQYQVPFGALGGVALGLAIGSYLAWREVRRSSSEKEES